MCQLYNNIFKIKNAEMYSYESFFIYAFFFVISTNIHHWTFFKILKSWKRLLKTEMFNINFWIILFRI